MAGRASSPMKKIFGSPYMGIMNSLPEQEVPPNALWAAFNCVFATGQVITRQSMVKLSTVVGSSAPSFDTRPLGVWMALTSVGALDIYVSTHTNLYRLRNLGGAWTDISGALTLTNGNTHTPRWASLYNQSTTQTITIMVNGIDDAVYTLDGTNFVSLAIGSSEKAIDICTAASRFVAIIPPYRVRWSDIYAGSFPGLNFYTAQDTPGRVVAVRNLGTLGVCIYKEDSIVVGYSQPGSPANAFRFETRVELPGPAGPSAVVQAEGKHFLMTARGRIGMFDGTRFEWVGDGIWPYMIGDFDINYKYQAHGFYDELYGQVWFVYPRFSDAGNGPTGIAIISLPRPAWGVPSYGVWAGAFAVPVSCSNTLRTLFGYMGLVMRSDPGNLNAELITDPAPYSSFGDDGVDFPCFLQTGLQPMGDFSKIDIEPFVQRSSNLGVCTLSPVTSYALTATAFWTSATPGSNVGTGQTVDLEDSSIIHAVKGFNASGRFVGLRIDWQSRVPESPGPEEGGKVLYKGAALYGYPVEQP